ncbi:MAG: hypothetical protein ACTSVV_11240 [Promethearchaeota archaeon]
MKKLTNLYEILKFLEDHYKKEIVIDLAKLSKIVDSNLLNSAYFKFTIDYLVSQGAIIVKKEEKNTFLELKDEKILHDYIEKKIRPEGNYLKDLKKGINYDDLDLLNDSFLRENNKEVIPAIKKIKKGKILKKPFPIIVYTIPLSKREEFNKFKQKYSSYKIIEFSTIVKDLLKAAKEEILISSPFIDSEGILFIMEELKHVVKNNVRLKILARGITNKGYATSDWKYVRLLIGIKNIFQIFMAEGKDNLIKIKNYNVDISPTAFNVNLHHEGIHQKLFMMHKLTSLS